MWADALTNEMYIHRRSAPNILPSTTTLLVWTYYYHHLMVNVPEHKTFGHVSCTIGDSNFRGEICQTNAKHTKLGGGKFRFACL